MMENHLKPAFLPWPQYGQDEANAAQQVLLSNQHNYWTGQHCHEFEQAFAKWTDSQYAISLCNGSVALELALMALDIGPGDEVIVSPRTFIASVSSVILSGGIPVFADVDLNSQNIEAHTIEAVVSDKTKAVVVVHLGGIPADMNAIMALAKKHNFYVIEDCAQAHGARFDNRSVGSIGHIAAWSFCHNKIISTGGEGGMITTNNETLYNAMWSFKDHGKSNPGAVEKPAAQPPGQHFRWSHQSFGTNRRMTEMQAAIGLVQLGKVSQWHQQRLKHGALIDAVARRHKSVRAIELKPNMEPAEYVHYLFVNTQGLATGWDTTKILEQINALGVPCGQGSCPEVYLEAAFDDSPFKPSKRLPNAKQLGETSLMFQVHPGLSSADMDKTVTVLEQVFAAASAKA